MSSSPDPVAVLADHLRQVAPALLAIPGVTGCGIGLSVSGSGQPVVQVFVADRRVVGGVGRDAARVLGASPFDVVVMSPPSADVRRPQAPDRSREDP